MTIELYVSTSEKERMDKTSYLSLIGSFDGALRQDSSIINPTILMQLSIETQSAIIDEDDEELEDADGDDVSIDTNRVTQANYMFIPEFGRYYFINDIVVGKTGIYTIRASVDVLMTYKDAIGDIECFVDRNEFTFSAKEQDELLPLKMVKEVSEIQPTRGDLVNTDFSASFDNSTDENIVITLVNDSGGIADDISNPGGLSLPSITPEHFAPRYASTPYRINPITFAKVASAMFDPNYSTFNDFVKSIVAFPFVPRIDDENLFGTLWFGKVDYDNHSTAIATDTPGEYVEGHFMNYFSDYVVVADFIMPTISSFLDVAPYARYELFIPFCGWVELDIQNLEDTRIIVYYSVNFEDGSATAYVFDFRRGRCIYSAPCQLGVKMALSATNQRELNTQRNAENTNLAIGLISSALSVGAGVATGNPLAVAGGILAGAKSVTGYINANAMMFDRASASFSGSSAGLYSPLLVKLRTTKTRRVVSDLSGYAHSRGRPLRQIKKLSSLSGFTIAQNPHLDNVPCLGTEADEIARLLSTGVIL